MIEKNKYIITNDTEKQAITLKNENNETITLSYDMLESVANKFTQIIRVQKALGKYN